MIDPSRDFFDELSDDPLIRIYELINDAGAQHNYRNFKSPDAGPWHLLDDSTS